MLTKQELDKRIWGRYPTMRVLLQNKKIPDKYYGATSVSNNLFNESNRLLELLLLTKEFINSDCCSGKEQRISLIKELYELQKEINWFKRIIVELNDDVQTLVTDIENDLQKLQ